MATKAMKEIKHIILGVHITDRVQNAGEVQKLFSEYGCSIKTRLGLHEVHHNACSPNGLILLEVVGEDAEVDQLRKRLAKIKGVQVKKMEFTHT